MTYKFYPFVWVPDFSKCMSVCLSICSPCVTSWIDEGCLSVYPSIYSLYVCLSTYLVYPTGGGSLVGAGCLWSNRFWGRHSSSDSPSKIVYLNMCFTDKHMTRVKPQYIRKCFSPEGFISKQEKDSGKEAIFLAQIWLVFIIFNFKRRHLFYLSFGYIWGKDISKPLLVGLSPNLSDWLRSMN